MKANIFKRFSQTLFTLVIQGVFLFLSAWTLDWFWGWIYMITGVVLLIFNLFVLPGEVIEERGRKKTNVKKWDKLLSAINAFPIMGIYIVSGLDYRLGWSAELANYIHIIGLILYISGSLLFTWSMIANKFFSTMVRIQTDRNHQVVTKGPYQFVRHPGYVGFILMFIVTSIVLGSLYALILSGIVTLILIIRTALEDQTLKAELEGYTEYAGKVKYRLLPFIW
ncbi:MAG: isoprenylcysteine carboxylmethyltransferase family protein [Bacteroidota bacterium]